MPDRHTSEDTYLWFFPHRPASAFTFILAKRTIAAGIANMVVSTRQSFRARSAAWQHGGRAAAWGNHSLLRPSDGKRHKRQFDHNGKPKAQSGSPEMDPRDVPVRAIRNDRSVRGTQRRTVRLAIERCARGDGIGGRHACRCRWRCSPARARSTQTAAISRITTAWMSQWLPLSGTPACSRTGPPPLTPNPPAGTR